MPIPPDLTYTMWYTEKKNCTAGRHDHRQAGTVAGSSFYLGIKIDCDQFGFWISSDEWLSEVVLRFFRDRLGPVYILLFLIPVGEKK